VSVADRKRNAAREAAKLRKKGREVSPVEIEGRAITKTFWGRAWCENLERYSDYANRLPRGRTYVRNGSVMDLQVAPGTVSALVSGSEIYTVTVKVAPVPKARWNAISQACAGAIDSLVELLQGRFSKGVMERICEPKSGLFPSPGEIELECSCPDWASMCKHVAAVLYGIGARLDQKPELLFRLRKVDEKALIARAGHGVPLAKTGPRAEKVLAGASLSELFGIEMAQVAETGVAAARRPKLPRGSAAKRRAPAGRQGARPTVPRGDAKRAKRRRD
jgi:uncharacterized Zn finger protein